MNIVKNVTQLAKPVLKLLDNPYAATAVSLFLVLYGSMARPELPDVIKNLFQNDIFRLVYVFLLAYVGDKNPKVALVVAVVFMVVMGLLADQEVEEAFEGGMEDDCDPEIEDCEDELFEDYSSGDEFEDFEDNDDEDDDEDEDDDDDDDDDDNDDNDDDLE